MYVYIYIYTHACICVWVRTCEFRCLQKPEALGPLELVTGGRELLYVDARNPTRSSARAVFLTSEPSLIPLVELIDKSKMSSCVFPCGDPVATVLVPWV